MNKRSIKWPDFTVRRCSLAVCLVLLGFCGFGQSKDTTQKFKPERPNIIKLSVSSWLLYPSSFHMGYERVLNENHSIYIFGGYNQFPIKLDLVYRIPISLTPEIKPDIPSGQNSDFIYRRKINTMRHMVSI